MALPDTSTSQLSATLPARRYKIDVDTSAAQDGSQYVRVMGITDFTPNTGTAQLQDDSDYDSDGFASQSATGQEWGATFTVRRAPRRSAPTTYDPGQEFIRGRARGTGPDNTVRVRIYEYTGASGPQVEAFEGYAATAWAPQGGAQTALSTATVTLTGQGVLLPIAHPAGTAVPTPTVTLIRYASATGAAPAGSGTTPAAGGGLLYVSGSGFSTATQVTVFGNVVPLSDWDAVTDNHITLKAPAHAAGTGDVTVTNPSGTSVTSAASKVTYA